MKKLICTAIAICVVLPAVALAGPGGRGGFVRTSKKYNERDNYAAICHDEFGMRADVAEWNDIKDLIRKDPYMRDFIEETGLANQKDSALLYFRGEKWGPGSEAYIIQMRNHERSKRHDGVVDQIGDFLFELKVRNNNAKPVLCYVPRGPHGNHHDDPPPLPPPPPVVYVAPTVHPVIITGGHATANTAHAQAQAAMAAEQARQRDEAERQAAIAAEQARQRAEAERQAAIAAERARVAAEAAERARLAAEAAERARLEAERHRDPQLLSTRGTFREFHFLNDKCRDEFGPGARIADWDDIRRMVRTPRDLEKFLRDNDIHSKDRDRLIYFGGGYKNARDRHYYLIYNERLRTPSGVTPIDSMHGNRLNVAAMMHLRTRVLCFVP